MVDSTSHFDDSSRDWDDEPRRVALMKAIGEAIVREATPMRDMKLLDYGCGTGLIGLFLLPYVHSVTGADNSPGMLQVLREKIAANHLKNMDAVQLDLEQEAIPSVQYDMITVGMALHHIENTEKVLRAFYEMLNPGGTLCIADLDTEPGNFHPAEMKDIVHHHGFHRDRLMQKLSGIGFTATRDTTVVTFCKPVEGEDEQEFSIFLIHATRPSGFVSC
jgi:ubiquinone/menaquinone biosynthesis C-methylase UbiE